ncbi:Uncharacterised protein [Serratia quinivorans]|uniref:Uncharacterized protein n=1 Tax=Serratia quinivorans TaxID=137545 RepID=A0A380ALZ9_9GAMM|nr:Uncharacterised protein [Serratia quinivorans]
MYTSGNVQGHSSFCGGGFQLFLCLILDLRKVGGNTLYKGVLRDAAALVREK